MKGLQQGTLAAAISTALLFMAATAHAAVEPPLVFDGHDGEIAPGSYDASADKTEALRVINGASVLGSGVNLFATGVDASGAVVRGAGSELSLTDSSVTSEGSVGVQVTSGASALLDKVTVRGMGGITASGDGTRVEFSNGSVAGAMAFSISSKAVLKVVGAEILAGHDDPKWATQGVRLGTGATLDISDSTIRNTAGNGILATAGSTGNTITANNLRIYSSGSNGGESVALTGGASLVARSLWIQASADAGAGVSASRSSRFKIEDSEISVGNEYTQAVYVSNSVGTLRKVDLNATGDYGFGLAVSGATSRADYSGGHVIVSGRGSTALYAGAGSRLSASGVEVTSLGDEGWGLWAGPSSQVTFADGSIMAAGAGSYAVGIRDTQMEVSNAAITTRDGAGGIFLGAKSKLSLLGSSLSTQDQAALRVEESTLRAVSSSVKSGNGRLAELISDAASEFILEQGSSASGDIVFSLNAADTDGNLILDATSTLALSGGSHWMGATDAIAVMNAQSSQWTMTGDSTVGSLGLHNSTLQMSQLGATDFNRLTVEGDFEASDSVLIFNGALGGDGSPIDFLHVRGDTKGSAEIRVNNVHGLGAQTSNGIQLVEVDGASNAVYTLSGRAVAGSYDYFLHKGGVTTPGDGGWYLRSEYSPAPPNPCDDDPDTPGCEPPPVPEPCELDPAGPGCEAPKPEPCELGQGGQGCEEPRPEPCEVDPNGPGCGIVEPDPCNTNAADGCNPPDRPRVVRPEAGAYLANQAAAVSLFQHSLQERNAATGAGRRGWLRVYSSHTRQDLTNQLGSSGRASTLMGGADLLQWGEAAEGRAGVLLASGRASTDVHSNVSGYSATGTVKGAALGTYATWMQSPDDAAGVYVDGWAMYGRYRNTVQGIGLSKERYDSRTGTASIEAGYSWKLNLRGDAKLLIKPQLQLTYTDYRDNQLTERNGTEISNETTGGIAARLGVAVSGDMTSPSHVMQPYVLANWLQNRSRNRVWMDDALIEGPAPRNRYEVRGGGAVQIGNSWSLRGDLGVQRGENSYRSVSAQLELRASW